MKKLLLASALVAGGLVGLQSSASAHGGNYRGPGDTVPPAGGGSGGGGAAGPTGPSGPTTPGPTGPTTPTPLAPGTPTQAAPTASTTSGGGASGPDLTLWSFWWEFNKEPYLNLKSAVHSGAADTGSDGFFLGRGQKEEAKDNLKPTEQQIREKIVPALLNALENETNNDIVTGAMIALAKIGDAKSESGTSKFEQVISQFLSDSNQEISETAAVSLGILANDKSVPLMASLLEDTAEGRTAVKGNEVAYRTRAFAAYGLGLIGAATGDEAVRQNIVEILARTIANDQTRSRDLKVACIIAMGLVPLHTFEAAPVEGEEDMAQPPHRSRVAQIEYLLDFLRNEDNNYLVRAHCPTALARLIDGLPAELYTTWRQTLADDLLSRIGDRSKDKNEIIESAVLAMGLIVTNGKADAKLRDALEAVTKDVSDQQARNFSLVSTAKAAANPGGEGADEGIANASKYLVGQLTKGKSTLKPWAGLAIGVMSRSLADNDVTHASVATMGEALRRELANEGDKSKIGAYAIALGIMTDVESRDLLIGLLDRIQDNEARGYVAVSLGLMGEREAIDPISEIIQKSKYRPDLLKQAAIALGLLGDKELVPTLVEMLGSSKGLATQAAISSALGFIGDQRSISPLVDMLGNKDLTARARGFAAVALGIVADKEPLPWNTKIALDLNYRASTSTLVDSSNGTGILDIL